jgi:predicted MFS family arabinose efflux permease
VFFACVAGGSTVGGLWYGSRHWPGRERLRLPFTLVAFAAGMGVLALVLATGGRPALGILLPVLVLTGLSISPGLIIQQALIDEHAAPDRRSEAQGWLTTGLTAGSAAGMAVAGFLVDRAGPASAFGGGAVALVVAALVAVVAQRWWRERVASTAGDEARV